LTRPVNGSVKQLRKIKSPIGVIAALVAVGVRSGTCAFCANGAASIVNDEVRSPRMATTRSWVRNLRTILAVSPDLDWLSSMIRLRGWRRMPPAELISSAANFVPCTLEIPNVDSPPERQLTTPTLISPLASGMRRNEKPTMRLARKKAARIKKGNCKLKHESRSALVFLVALLIRSIN